MVLWFSGGVAPQQRNASYLSAKLNQPFVRQFAILWKLGVTRKFLTEQEMEFWV